MAVKSEFFEMGPWTHHASNPMFGPMVDPPAPPPAPPFPFPATVKSEFAGHENWKPPTFFPPFPRFPHPPHQSLPPPVPRHHQPQNNSSFPPCPSETPFFPPGPPFVPSSPSLSCPGSSLHSTVAPPLPPLPHHHPPPNLHQPSFSHPFPHPPHQSAISLPPSAFPYQHAPPPHSSIPRPQINGCLSHPISAPNHPLPNVSLSHPPSTPLSPPNVSLNHTTPHHISSPDVSLSHPPPLSIPPTDVSLSHPMTPLSSNSSLPHLPAASMCQPSPDPLTQNHSLPNSFDVAFSAPHLDAYRGNFIKRELNEMESMSLPTNHLSSSATPPSAFAPPSSQESRSIGENVTPLIPELPLNALTSVTLTTSSAAPAPALSSSTNGPTILSSSDSIPIADVSVFPPTASSTNSTSREPESSEISITSIQSLAPPEAEAFRASEPAAVGLVEDPVHDLHNDMFIDIKYAPPVEDTASLGLCADEPDGTQTPGSTGSDLFKDIKPFVPGDEMMVTDIKPIDVAGTTTISEETFLPGGVIPEGNAFSDVLETNPANYAQTTHTLLRADPLKIGRYFDGRPRPHDPFTCYLCHLEFPSSEELFDHMRRHHGGTWSENVCPVCGKQLLDKPGVSTHFDLVHKKLRPYKCDICHSWWGFAKHDVMRHKNAAHLKAKYECTLCQGIYHNDLNLRNHYKSRHDCRIRFRGHFGPEVDHVIPLSPTGAKNVEGNPRLSPRLLDYDETAVVARKRKRASELLSAGGSTNFVAGSAPPYLHPPNFPFPSFPTVKTEAFAAAQPAPLKELVLYECAECGNRYGHKDLIKFHLNKKHGVENVDDERARKVLSPYNRFCKGIYESVRERHPDLPNTEISKIVGQMWREAAEEEKKKFRDEYEKDLIEAKEIVERYERLWVKRFMCMRCDRLFDDEAELSGHSAECASLSSG